MGADNTYPGHPYQGNYAGYNRPYYNQGGYPPPNYMPPYRYPPNYGMGYGRGFHHPYPPMNTYRPMMNGFHQAIFPNQLGGPGFFGPPRAATGGLQSAPPFTTPDGNIQLNRLSSYPPGSNRPDIHRPYFDEQ